LTPGEHVAHWLRLQRPQEVCGGWNSHLALARLIGLTRAMRFFALVDLSLLEAIQLYVRREDAERTLAELLRDEPSWAWLFRIEEIELGELSRN
jgi:hypothetical protein